MRPSKEGTGEGLRETPAQPASWTPCDRRHFPEGRGAGGGSWRLGQGPGAGARLPPTCCGPQAFPRLLLGPLKTRSCCSRRWSELLRAGNAASRAFRLPAQAPEGRLSSFLPEPRPVRVGVGVRVRGRQLKAEVGRVPSPVLPLPHLNPQVRLSQPLLSGSHIL